MNGLWKCALAVACVAAVLPLAGAQSVYSCVDAKGRTITADRPIIECIDRSQDIRSSSGRVTGTIGPSLTAQERTAQEARERREAEEQARAAEERRRDRALLARYPNKPTHDKERAEALTQVDAVIGAAKQRVSELVRERQQLDIEMEFYAKDPARAPGSLKRQIAGNEQSIALQQRFIDDQQSEKKRINERFDDELARLQPLWTSGANKAAAGAVKPASSAAAR